VLACLTAASLGCSRPPPPILLVVIDTLRADRIDAFGGTRGATPFLDSLAARSWVFQRAYASSSWTSPSVASLFTSRYPSQHGVTTFESVMGEEEATLAESLRQFGYATAAFSGNSLVRRDLGFAQGFGHFGAKRGRGFAFRRKYERTDQTGARAVAWGDRISEKFGGPLFLYLQVMDPHTPYAPSAEALAWAFDGMEPPDVDRLNDAVFDRNKRTLATAERDAFERLYDAEVRSMDRSLQQTFDAFAERGLLDRAIVVVVSDHGEEFWDHGSVGHTNGLFDEVIRVPMLIHLPGQAERFDVREPVSVLDVAPTLLDLVGAPIPAAFEGRSLRPLLEEGSGAAAIFRRFFGDRTNPPTPVVSEFLQPVPMRRRAHERVVVIGSYKLIADVDGARHYFDLTADPFEREPASLPEGVRADLDRALADFVDRVPLEVNAREIPRDAESETELRSLGYIE
jgi:arylsulfatase A-like enzyme